MLLSGHWSHELLLAWSVDIGRQQTDKDCTILLQGYGSLR